jgi:hypothetical protein
MYIANKTVRIVVTGKKRDGRKGNHENLVVDE